MEYSNLIEIAWGMQPPVVSIAWGYKGTVLVVLVGPWRPNIGGKMPIVDTKIYRRGPYNRSGPYYCSS